MAFASLILKPGVDTESTPTALRAGYSQSAFGRFRAGFFEKIGGWTKFYPFAVSGVPRALQAWLDLNEAPWLGVGATRSLSAIDQNGNLTTITPQIFTSDIAPKFTTVISTTSVTVKDANLTATVTINDTIELKTPIAVGGIILSGAYPVVTVLSATQYTITAASAAASSVTDGGAVPVFTTTNGSSSVNVALTAHGLVAGNSAVFPLSTSVGGVTILGTYQVITRVDANNFTIASTTRATSGATISMNSGNAEILYYCAIGPASASGTTYSFSTYSTGPYSGTGAASSQQTGTNITTTDWTTDNWNDRLIACPANGGIYQWQPNGGLQNAQLIGSAPVHNSGVIVTAPRLGLLAYGSSVTKDIGIAQDPLVYKISDLDDYTFWETNVVNPTTGASSQAFESRIPTGTAVKAAMAAPNQLLLWTDLDLWAVNYVNLPTIWTQTKIGSNCGTVSRHSIAQMSGVIYWRGKNNFHALAGGAPAVIPCSVWDAVFQNQDTANLDKCFIETVTSFSEVWFFWPSASSADGNCDSYAKVNVLDGSWDYGSLPRSIGIDQSVVGNPVMATPTGVLYSHETGYDADAQPISPSFMTGEFYMGDGEDFVFVDQFYPDFHWTTFDGSTSSAIVQVTFYVKNYPGDTARTYGPYSMSVSTLKLDVRFRGRMCQIAMTSTDVGSFWRIGKPYFRAAPSGRR